MTDQIRAPWTAEQVAALNRFQREGGMHPFTCGARDTAHPNREGVLFAREDGWHCPVDVCDYRQDWALAFMANPDAWPRPFAAADQLPQMRHRRLAAMCDPSIPDQPTNPAAAPSPLAAYRSWLTEQRDRAAACALARPLTEEPTPGELAWMHEGARTAYDDALKALQGAAPAPDAGLRELEQRYRPNTPPSRPPAPAPAGLREQYAAALWPLIDWDGDRRNAEHAADAVLAVRDREMEQLRQRIAELEQQAADDDQEYLALANHTDETCEAVKQRDQLADVVRDFLDPDPCLLDHHGYCQGHSWLCKGRCPHARARDLLTALDQPAGEGQ